MEPISATKKTKKNILKNKLIATFYVTIVR